MSEDTAAESKLDNASLDDDDDRQEITLKGSAVKARASLNEDGRIDVAFSAHGVSAPLPDLPFDYAKSPDYKVEDVSLANLPSLNIVIFIVGSRGDVQPFLALGQGLKAQGHRVRIATHETFRKFVEDADLEHFDIGGDPDQLMRFMVKNPGLIPSSESMKNGDIGRQKKIIKEILHGSFTACFEPGQGAHKDEPFAADFIISNPPAFPTHVAEALGLPLHLVFTMPWSPSREIAHPLVNIISSDLATGLTNYLSYSLFDLLTFQGLRSVINDFRQETLGLPLMESKSGIGLFQRLKLPWTYCWSPNLVPKPTDWSNLMEICGFFTSFKAPEFEPPQDLVNFLKAGDKPIYVGFGSVPIDNVQKVTKYIYEASKDADVRVLLSAGWAKLGEGVDCPSHVFIVGDVPHTWLFNECSGTCSHGGAGTTAASLAAGLPALICPFFGDQAWWGQAVFARGAGPKPIQGREIDAANLAAAFKEMRQPQMTRAAQEVSTAMKQEQSVENALQSIYRHLPVDSMRCSILPSKTAAWWSSKHFLPLSGAAAGCLIQKEKLEWEDLKPYRVQEYQTRAPIKDPVTGSLSTLLETVLDYHEGMSEQLHKPKPTPFEQNIALPIGAARIISSVQEGLYNFPTLYGSSVRENEPPANIIEGVKQASQGLAYGFVDPFIDFYKESKRAIEKNGPIGVVKGVARAGTNFGFKPVSAGLAAGILGLATLPVEGIINSLRNALPQASKSVLEAGRRAAAATDFKSLSQTDQDSVVQKFEELACEDQVKKRHSAAFDMLDSLSSDSKPKE